MPSKTTKNLANFAPKGRLGQLFAKGRAYNRINNQLSTLLPPSLKSLSLCMIDDETATFITNNQALAFRGQKQSKDLLSILRTLEGLSHIQKVKIKVDIKEY